MNRTRLRRAQRMRERRRTRIMILAFALVLFVGLFAQVAMVSRLSTQAKASQKVEREIKDLGANADNLRLSLNQFKNLDRVAAQAVRLGMAQPTENQIRVLSLPGYIASTSAQSAENVGAEEMQ